MEDNKVSLSALMIAYIRAYHSIHAVPKIFDDFLAYDLLTQEERTMLEQGLAKSLQLYNPERAASCPNQATALEWVVRDMAGSSISLGRARYTEDRLDEAVMQGVQQYVLLGAGMDTFAFRRPEMVKQLQVFEVDLPTTQAFKRRRVAELGWEQPDQLHFVPVDFTQGNLALSLERSSYNPKALTFFSWLGVTYYLPREAVIDTLGTVANIAPIGSKIIFDYLDNEAFVPEKVAKRVQGWQRQAQRVGEPLKAGFDPFTLASDLKSLGLRLDENLSPSEIEGRYFQRRTDDYHACEHAYFACAVVE